MKSLKNIPIYWTVNKQNRIYELLGMIQQHPLPLMYSLSSLGKVASIAVTQILTEQLRAKLKNCGLDGMLNMKSV